jgi:hypothetical protein
VLVEIRRGDWRCAGAAGMGMDGRGGEDVLVEGMSGSEERRSILCPSNTSYHKQRALSNQVCAFLNFLLIDRVSSCLHALVQENLAN